MGRPRVLLVDDDADFVEATRIVLESNGYEVLCAATGPDGLAKARNEKPGLVILDVMLSRTTEGFEVLNQLRSHTETRGMRVLMLTGVESRFAGARLDTEQLSAELFVEKPVKPGELLSRVESLLER